MSLKKSFSPREIADYYRLSRSHYKTGWNLDDSMALHYGYWDNGKYNHHKSLNRLNEELAIFGKIKRNQKVLDAGCGVGGSSIFLAKSFGCQCIGITLDENQVKDAKRNAEHAGCQKLTRFAQADFTDTGMDDGLFDIVWAIESVIHADPKDDFFKEAYRLLKPGGQLVIADYFAKKELNRSDHALLMKWLNPWAVSDILDFNTYSEGLMANDFQNVRSKNITPFITAAARRMYRGGRFLKWYSKVYNLLNPTSSWVARTHHIAMITQWEALQKGLWSYHFVSAQKPGENLS